MIWRIFSSATLILLSACNVGPDYVPPVVQTPSQWRVSLKEASTYASLEWWRSLGDPQLNRLIETALRENQDLKMALARIEEYCALLGVAESALFPRIDISGNATRYVLKKNALVAASGTSIPDPVSSFSYNNFGLNAGLSYEIGFLGEGSPSRRISLCVPDGSRGSTTKSDFIFGR